VLIGGGGPEAGKWIGPMVKPVQALVTSPFVSQDLGMFLAILTCEDMQRLAELMSSGAVTPVIDRRHALSEAAAAIRYLEQGRARGKVVVTME
jgi:D-arabinose 1-dehydrogenase-like Zn-dependent alcohol dehydrogenase